jgi:hypothetical protein
MKVMLAFALMGANEQQMRSMLAGVGLVLLVLAAALAIGLHAWSKRHSILGWFTRIVAVVVGGLAGTIGSLTLDALPKKVQDAMPEFVVVASIVAFMCLGAWLALRLVNLFADRKS